MCFFHLFLRLWYILYPNSISQNIQSKFIHVSLYLEYYTLNLRRRKYLPYMFETSSLYLIKVPVLILSGNEGLEVVPQTLVYILLCMHTWT